MESLSTPESKEKPGYQCGECGNEESDHLDLLMAGHEKACVEFKHGRGGYPHKEFWSSSAEYAIK